MKAGSFPCELQVIETVNQIGTMAVDVFGYTFETCLVLIFRTARHEKDDCSGFRIQAIQAGLEEICAGDFAILEVKHVLYVLSCSGCRSSSYLLG